MGKRSQRTEISANRVLQEIEKMAFLDVLALLAKRLKVHLISQSCLKCPS